MQRVFKLLVRFWIIMIVTYFVGFEEVLQGEYTIGLAEGRITEYKEMLYFFGILEQFRKHLYNQS